MLKNTEIVTDIANKIQPAYLIVERISDGKGVPKSFIKLAKRDIIEAEKLLSKLEG